MSAKVFTEVMTDTHHAGSLSKGTRQAFTVTLLKVEHSPIGEFFVLDKVVVNFDEDANVTSRVRTATVYRDAKEAIINALNTWNEIVMTYQDEEPTQEEGIFPF